MKKYILSLIFLCVMHTAYADETCGLVVPATPGGVYDTFARLIQKHNPDMQIVYKPGAYSANAIAFMKENKNYALLSLPSMYSKNNKGSADSIELFKTIASPDQLILTNKNITFEKLLSGKVNIGVPLIGTAGHLIALQLTDYNPQINIIPFGGDAKALPSLDSGEIDAYITGAPTALKWIKNFEYKTVLYLPANRIISQSGVIIRNTTALNSIFFYKSATITQKKKLAACINAAITSEEWVKELALNGTQAVLVSQDENKRLLQSYINLLNRYDY